MPANPRYPKPGDAGGRLLRQTIAHLRAQGLELPLTSHILIAVSGGADSLALLRLLARYGRRIVPHAKLRALHVNHGWRGEASAEDARFVREQCEVLGVPLTVRELDTAYLRERGDSLEERARALRRDVFREELATLPEGARLWTAHQADDLAETMIWRFFTGTLHVEGGGILFDTGLEQRPLLQARRAHLEAFLREEGLTPLADPSNQDPRFLRARLRREVMPAVEAVFPRAVEHMTRLAITLQKEIAVPGLDSARNPMRDALTSREFPTGLLAGVFRAAGVRVRRSNWNEIEKLLRTDRGVSRVTLPEGWTLKRIKKRVQKKAEGLTERRKMHTVKAYSRAAAREQWVLERAVSSPSGSSRKSREKDNSSK